MILRVYALVLRCGLIASCLLVGLSLAAALTLYPQLIFVAALVRAWRWYRRIPAPSGWSHGSAIVANLALIAKGGLLSPRGFVLGKLFPEAPSRWRAITGLINSRLDSAMAVSQFLAAWFGGHWMKDRMLRIGKHVHIAVFAPSGAGKGRSIIIPNLLACPDSMVVVDVKGELHEATARHRKQRLRNRIITLAPLGINGKAVPSDTLNPLDFIDEKSESFIDDCRELAYQLVTRSGRENDDHWLDSATTVLKIFIMFVCACEKTHRNLSTVRMLVSSLHAYEKAMRIMLQSPNPLVRAGGGQLTLYVDKERASILSTVQRFTEFLDGPAIARNVERSSFHPNFLKTGKATLYLSVPPSKLASLAPLQRMWIGTIMRVTTSGVANERNPVLWILDEFAHIGKIQAVEDAVTLLRGAGVRLVFCFQAHSQLKECFNDKALTVMDNLATQIYFGISSLDTAKTVSERIGERTISTGSYNRTTSSSRPVGGGGAKGESPGSISNSSSYTQSDMARKVVRPEEILTLDADTAIILHRNVPCVFARLIKYYEAREFRRHWLTGAWGTGKQRGLGLAAGVAACLVVAVSLAFATLVANLPEPETVSGALLHDEYGAVPAYQAEGVVRPIARWRRSSDGNTER